MDAATHSDRDAGTPDAHTDSATRHAYTAPASDGAPHAHTGRGEKSHQSTDDPWES